MSAYGQRSGMSRLPGWRTGELPEGQPEAVRVRGPVVRPSDFVGQPQATAIARAVDAPVDKPASRAVAPEATAIQEPQPDGSAAVYPVHNVSPAPARAYADPAAPSSPSPQRNEAPVQHPLPQLAAPILDLRTATRAIWAKRLVILVLAGVGAVLGAGVIPLVPKKFSAETSLYFDPRQAGVQDSSQAGVAPDLILTMIDSQTQILSSGKVLGRVVDAMKLDRDPQFNGGATGETARYIATATLQKAVLIAREASTYVVTLKVTTRDPDKSALIANQIVASFMEEESKAASSSFSTASTALDNRIEDLRQQVLSAEKAVEAYRADNDMVAVNGNLMSDKRLSALTDLLVTAQQKTIEAKARADAVGRLSFEDVVSSARPDALNSTSNSLSNLRQQYAALAATVGSLESQLGARHPRLLAARSSLASLASEIRDELQRLGTSARADYEQARKAEQDTAKELAAQQVRQVNTSGKMVELNELERKAAAARDLYEGLMKRSGQTSEQQGLSPTNIRVISEAEPPLTPDGPSRKVMMVAGLIAGAVFGLCLGIVFAIVLSLFRHPVVRTYLSSKPVVTG